MNKQKIKAGDLLTIFKGQFLFYKRKLGIIKVYVRKLFKLKNGMTVSDFC